MHSFPFCLNDSKSKDIVIEEGKTYYIQDSRYYIRGGIAWITSDKTMTIDLDKARLFTADQVKKYITNPTDIPWESNLVKDSVVSHIEMEKLQKNFDNLSNKACDLTMQDVYYPSIIKRNLKKK